MPYLSFGSLPLLGSRIFPNNSYFLIRQAIRRVNQPVYLPFNADVLAVGALSYLNAERLAPLRGRNIVLFPDLSKDGSAFARWSRIADVLRPQGFSVTASDYLEQRATDEQKAAGLDLADYLLD